MSKAKVHFKVGKNGDATLVDVTGAGSQCQDLTSGVERALGIIDEKSRAVTASAYEPVDPLYLTNERS